MKYSIADLSEEDFFRKLGEFLDRRNQSAENEDYRQCSTGRLVYGIRGVEELFGCSHKTAQYIKDHVICEAVSQRGRKIVIDADLALKLFNERRTNNGK